MTTDHAGRTFWDQKWHAAAPPAVIDPSDRGMRNYVHVRLCRLLEEQLAGSFPGGRLLEVGCANSPWLPWYDQGLGAETWGLDYSEIGCRQAEMVLESAGRTGTIVCGDLFDPPKHLLGAFDGIVSWGVVEHFSDTADALASLGRMLAPGGKMVTLIPNMAGATGWVTKVTNRPVYDTHQVIDREQFATAHRLAGLKLHSCDYFISANPGVVNLEGAPVGPWRAVAQRVAVAALSRLAWGLWALERRTTTEPLTRTWSPYVVAVASRPGPTSEA